MKRLFILGIVLGFAGTLAGVYFVPWFSYTRYASQTSVIANGGRAEQFVIRLPADRIYALDRGGEESDPAAESAEGSRPRTYVEHFKLRDTAGNVVGLAARHAVPDDASAALWLLSIPTRGAIMLTGTAVLPETVLAVLAENGWVRGEPWAGQVTLADAATAQSVAATKEFEGLSIELSETWTVSGFSEKGEFRGTIELDTIGRRGS